MLSRNTPLYFTPQNISEFWNVATRPMQQNGLGLPHELVMAELYVIEEILTLLPESPGIYGEWKRLVALHKVTGAKVYDARLVAVMNIYGVKSILTFNIADFARYATIDVLNPFEL